MKQYLWYIVSKANGSQWNKDEIERFQRRPFFTQEKYRGPQQQVVEKQNEGCEGWNVELIINRKGSRGFQAGQSIFVNVV